MNEIGCFQAGTYVPSQLDVNLAEVIDGLEALTLVPEGLAAVEATDRKISEFYAALAQRRTQRENEVNASFMNEDHVISICGSLSEENSAFVKNIVTDRHFLGNLTRKDVALILSDQKPKAGILYIESKWVPRDVRNSCSPSILIATLKFSFFDGLEGVTHCVLKPGYGIDRVCEENGAYFLDVEPTIAAKQSFKGFSANNILRMQKLTQASGETCEAVLKSQALTCYEVGALIIKEELDAVLEKEDKRSQIRTDRYSNILPYSCNSVETGIAGQDINGSYVRAGGRLFIACQGPKEETVEDFWQAVAYHGTETVIALGSSMEGRHEKFNSNYFIFDQKLTLSDGTCIQKIEENTALDWEFKTTNDGEEEVTINHCIISRSFECSSPRWGKHTVRHYHCPSWQDMMGGDPRVLTELIACIDNSAFKQVPVMVHCSAGVGRTGTLIAAYDINQQRLQNPEKPIAPLATIMELRHQRYGLVQSVKQIAMLLRFIAQK